MKRKMWLLTLAFLASWGNDNSARVNAQNPSVGATRSTIRWNAIKSNLPALGDGLTIKFDRAVLSSEWVIGVHTDNNQPGSIAVMGAKMRQGSYPGMKMPAQIDNLPTSNFSVGREEIVINRLGSPGQELIIYLEIPAGKQLTIKEGEKVVSSVRVNNDLVIKGSEISTTKVQGIHTPLMRLLAPANATDQPETVAANGKIIATSKGLGRHLTNLRRPDYPQSLRAASDSIGRVVIQITIDEQGNISKLSRVSGNEPYASLAESAVREWKFRPFEAGGKITQVVSQLTFFFGTDGEVKSAVFNEFGK